MDEQSLRPHNPCSFHPARHRSQPDLNHFSLFRRGYRDLPSLQNPRTIPGFRKIWDTFSESLDVKNQPGSVGIKLILHHKWGPQIAIKSLGSQKGKAGIETLLAPAGRGCEFWVLPVQFRFNRFVRRAGCSGYRGLIAFKGTQFGR